VAEILSGAEGYLSDAALPPVVWRAWRAIRECRTAALGGHAVVCPRGHVEGVWYNACRNRACPRCSFYRVRLWLERQARTLLGCAHHHIIFTMPHELNVLWLCNYRLLGDLLFKSARDALFDLASDTRYLGARPGVIAALHTWGQQLYLHPHIHCLVTDGGVDDGGQWIVSPRSSLLPAEPLKRLFRGKFLYGLRGLTFRGELRLPDGWAMSDVLRLCREPEDKRWNVYVCERYNDPTAVLNYLGRYLHGGPMGEGRLIAFDSDSVTFRYKDYRDIGPKGPRRKTITLSRLDFIRRYLQHVAPKGFHLVRGYGIYRRGGNTETLRRRVRETIALTPQLHRSLAPRELPPPEESDGMQSCSICGGPLRLISRRARSAPLRMAA
jgi:hypothetical protein